MLCTNCWKFETKLELQIKKETGFMSFKLHMEFHKLHQELVLRTHSMQMEEFVN